MKHGEFYHADLFAHRRKVYNLMTTAAEIIGRRGINHDASKLEPVEAEVYAPVVWELNHDGPAYGTDEYHALVKTLGPALEHHRAHNDHHPEHFESDDPLAKMDLFQVLEMACDWIAAASRHGGDPLAAMKQTGRKYPIDPQVKALLTNTVFTLCGDDAVLGWGEDKPTPTPNDGRQPTPAPCMVNAAQDCEGYEACTHGAPCEGEGAV